MNGCEGCLHVKDLLKTEMAVIRRHLDEHIYLRRIGDRATAVRTFIEDYGWLMRELYCLHICEDREHCNAARDLKKEGDLLRSHMCPDNIGYRQVFSDQA